ncbi:MAG: hypothetical protein KDD82_19950, partial [Planctomycetes bacterium]|nr:hypothetical protein [Planctomycetota bacterium]
MTTMTLSRNEIEYGRLAVSRGHATQSQLQECAQMRAHGAQEHLARLLVSKGYISEGVARQIYQELSQRSGAQQLTRSDSRPALPQGSGYHPAPQGSGYHPAPQGSGYHPAP